MRRIGASEKEGPRQKTRPEWEATGGGDRRWPNIHEIARVSYFCDVT